MEKTLKMDDAMALRLYKTADPEFKEMLEANFTKEFFNEDITEKVKDYDDILKMSGVVKDDDIVTIKGLSTQENLFISNMIKKVRIAKVYNEGWLPKRGEKRWYNWYNVSSGFSFNFTGCDAASAGTASAARLCFKNEDRARSAANKFGNIDKELYEFCD